jgi:hypothetical protein
LTFHQWRAVQRSVDLPTKDLWALLTALMRVARRGNKDERKDVQVYVFFVSMERRVGVRGESVW